MSIRPSGSASALVRPARSEGTTDVSGWLLEGNGGGNGGQGAEKGRGKYEFVQDSEDVAGKVISLLNGALTPCCDDFALEFNDSENLVYVVPEPMTMGFIQKNEPVCFFVFFN